jgi:AcrR family transcriptional regulator
MTPSANSIRIPAAERRALVLDAALRVFGRDGYAAARLDDIATEAGVTKPIVYRHFESKKALYLALLRRHHDDLPTFVEPEAPLGPAHVRAILEAWLAYAHERRDSWKLLFRDAGGDEEIRAYRRVVSDRAREVMADFARGVAPDIPPEQVEPTAELLRSGMAGVVLWWIDHPDVELATLAETLGRLIGALSAPSTPRANR